MLQLGLIFVFCVGAFAQVSPIGRCPRVEAQQNFTVDQYLGKWYEIGSYFSIDALGTKCRTVDLSRNNTNSPIIVQESQIDIFTGAVKTTVGNATLVDTSGEGKFYITFPPSSNGDVDLLWILGTDYTTYSVTWQCEQLGPFNFQKAQILSRNRDASEAVFNMAYEILKDNNLSTFNVIRTDQEDCYDLTQL